MNNKTYTIAHFPSSVDFSSSVSLHSNNCLVSFKHLSVFAVCFGIWLCFLLLQRKHTHARITLYNLICLIINAALLQFYKLNKLQKGDKRYTNKENITGLIPQ